MSDLSQLGSMVFYKKKPNKMHFSFKSPMSKFTGYSCKQQSPSAIHIVNYFQLNGFHLKRATKDSEQNKTKQKKLKNKTEKNTFEKQIYISSSGF